MTARIIYTYKNIVLNIIEFDPLYEMVEYKEIKWYFSRGMSEHAFSAVDYMVRPWTYSISEGFKPINYDINEEEKEKAIHLKKCLQILEKCNMLIVTHKLLHTKNEFAFDFYQTLLMFEMYSDKITDKILIKSKAIKNQETTDSIIEQLKIKYQDATFMFLYIEELKKTISEWLENKQYDDALNHIQQEYFKIKA